MDVFGHTRSRLANDHALITPDSHVLSPRFGWENSMVVVHISPEMGAGFTQYTAHMEAGGVSGSAGSGVERFVFLKDGEADLDVDSETHSLAPGGFAFLPPETEHTMAAKKNTTLIVFEKEYISLENTALPGVAVGNTNDVSGEPFQGDPDAVLQTLLPVNFEFDMAVNIFTYQPGATLPQVEMHVMEHGLQMISGQGVYRLSDSYYPVRDGDVIWMAPFCPQWFVAMGKTSASYIYFKDVHRDRLSDFKP